jgi:hypothetical protein
LRATLKCLLWAALCLNLWLLLIHLVVNRDAGSRPLISVEGLLTCALLVLAPALVFLPVASALPAPFFEVEATLGWGTLGFVAVFFPPSEPLTRGQFMVFLLPLTVALASLTTLIAYAFVRRLRGGRSTPGQFLQARRIGYLAALALVALALLSAFDVLTPFNGALIIAVAVLAESLAVASARATSGSA